MGDFVASKVVNQLQVKTHHVHNQVLSFVNGEQAPCNKEIQGVKLVIGDYYDNQAVLKVADLPHHNVILGKPWLEHHNPDIDWIKNEVSMLRKGKRIQLQAPKYQPYMGIQVISAIQAKRALRKGKDQFVLAFIKEDLASDKKSPSQAKGLLIEFADVFPDKLPAELPPIRSVDHRIELESNKTPSVSPVYRMLPKELEVLREEISELL